MQTYPVPFKTHQGFNMMHQDVARVCSSLRRWESVVLCVETEMTDVFELCSRLQVTA